MRTIFAALFGLSLIAWIPAFAAGEAVIDAGHGGYDSGLEAGGYREKDVSLQVARAVSEALKKNGRSAGLTRDIDRYISLRDRALIAAERKTDVFISIHLADSDGFAVYVYGSAKADGTGGTVERRQQYAFPSGQTDYIGRSGELSAAVEKALGEEFGLAVEHRSMRLPVLGPVRAPAILVEIPSKGVALRDSDRIASAIANGILTFESK